MKKGEIYEGKIEKYLFPNKGVTTLEDKKVTIKGALLGQTVRYMISKKKSGLVEGRLLSVLEKSELEDAAPMCPHYGSCGGCTYQTMSYENQLKLKGDMVWDILSGVLKNQDEFAWEGIFGSPVQMYYRNKMEFTFGDEVKDGPMTLGLHKKGSFYDILPITDCKIVSGGINAILKYTVDFYTRLGVPYFRRMKHTGVLRNLVVRQSCVNGDIMINLVTTTKLDLNITDEVADINTVSVKSMLCLDDYVAGLKGLEESGALCDDGFDGRIRSVVHTENDSFADAVICDNMEVIYGTDHLTEEVMGLKFNISPFSFFQTNTKGCEVLYGKARDYIMGIDGADYNDQVIFDLYSGTGTIAQMLAPVAKKVIGIEIIEEAVVAARENAQKNGLSNCEFIAGDVLKMLDTVEEKPDFIVLDPPRDGINPKALDKIINYGVDNIIYISCKPTSLARDLVIFQEKGYCAVKGCCIDQFPGTQHVETIVLITRDKNGQNS